MAIKVENKFLEMLRKKPRQPTKASIQMIVPGAKSRGDCANECLILRNCQNLNKRLINLILQYREVMSKINIFSGALTVGNRRDNSYDYAQGYDKCNQDIKKVCGKMMTREEENIIDIQSLIRESYVLISEVELSQRATTATSHRARALRLRYDAFFAKLRGDNNE